MRFFFLGPIFLETHPWRRKETQNVSACILHAHNSMLLLRTPTPPPPLAINRIYILYTMCIWIIYICWTTRRWKRNAFYIYTRKQKKLELYCLYWENTFNLLWRFNYEYSYIYVCIYIETFLQSYYHISFFFFFATPRDT